MNITDHLARAYLKRSGFATTATVQDRLIDYVAKKAKWEASFADLTPEEILGAIQVPPKTKSKPEQEGAK